MLIDTQSELLGGMVEVDESYVGGKNINRHKDKKVEGSQGLSAADKTPVVGLVERGGKVITFVTKDTNANTLNQIITSNVKTDATIVTDAYKGYTGVKKTHNHVTVKHEEGGYITMVNDTKFHTQNIENFWSQLKRGYVGIYHYRSPKHLLKYCDEFATRYNLRDVSSIERFL